MPIDRHNSAACSTLCLHLSFHAILCLSTSTCSFTQEIHISIPTHAFALYAIFSMRTLPVVSYQTTHPSTSSTSSIISLPFFQLIRTFHFPTIIILHFLLFNFILHLDHIYLKHLQHSRQINHRVCHKLNAICIFKGGLYLKPTKL